MSDHAGKESGWFRNENQWIFFDANWPHKPVPEKPPPPKPSTYKKKRMSRRCNALLDGGQRCAGPYHCPEH